MRKFEVSSRDNIHAHSAKSDSAQENEQEVFEIEELFSGFKYNKNTYTMHYPPNRHIIRV